MDLEEFLEKYMNIDKIDQKKYSVSSYKDSPELKPIIDKFLRRNKNINLKACFQNAQYMMRADPRIEYCEGYISYNAGDQSLPIEHAWNAFGDFHFDITSELLFDGKIGKGHNEYIELFRSNDKDEVKKVVNSSIRPYMKRKWDK